jgi:ATP-dependent Clp protease ATP-binding subunit ClpB
MGLLNQLLDPSRVGAEAVKLDSRLRERIVGQEHAIQQIVHVYQTHLAGMSSPGRPIGNLLFMGPTGSGKTRTVEAVAESLLGDARAVIKIDCAEFSHSHEIAKLIGSPPGYLGHRETHPLLSQETLNQHHTDAVKISFVLFDEIEKASDSLWNLLLGILDKAVLTLGDNSRVDFSRSMIFLTSNLGAAQMNALLRPNLGFAAGASGCGRAEGIVDEQLAGEMASAAVEAARRKFTPEFLNRIDKVVVFQPLGSIELRKILALELNSVQQRVLSSAPEAPFVFTTTESAKQFLMRDGTDLRYGARHLKRAIDRNVVQAFSNLIATEQVRGGDLIRVDYDDSSSCLTFIKEAEKMSVNTLLRMVDCAAAPPAVTASSARAILELPKAADAKTWRR